MSGGEADHYEVLIRFGGDYFRVALNDRIRCQHMGMFMAEGSRNGLAE